MAPYLLLGFFIAGLLHVFVPRTFYTKYLSQNNRFSVLWAALMGIPLPLCSCGVIPTAIGLKKEKASNGAIASFLIATPQTGIDSILATFSLMGLGFAIIRPAAALITGVCGGWLVNLLVKENTVSNTSAACHVEGGHPLWRALKYAYYDMIQDIGLRLVIGLVVAALIQVVVPDEFFLLFGHQPLLQMLVILLIAIPMYVYPYSSGTHHERTIAWCGTCHADGWSCRQSGFYPGCSESHGAPFYVDLSVHHRCFLHYLRSTSQCHRAGVLYHEYSAYMLCRYDDATQSLQTDMRHPANTVHNICLIHEIFPSI